jgi:hypothetical protein
MEQEITKLTLTCGNAYLAAMRVPMTNDELTVYNSSVEKLSTMKTELTIIVDMINIGHE